MSSKYKNISVLANNSDAVITPTQILLKLLEQAERGEIKSLCVISELQDDTHSIALSTQSVRTANFAGQYLAQWSMEEHIRQDSGS